ncbi:MAG: hypothetical protein IJ043_01470, partial [Clostridia bacterium]|nr:hypothetical protein [Clostridia bacterium]
MSNYDIVAAEIERQLKGKEGTAPWMVGEQLKEIARREPASAELLAKDLAVEAMSIVAHSNYRGGYGIYKDLHGIDWKKERPCEMLHMNKREFEFFRSNGLNGGKMKGYKGFEKGLVCRGKQYAENTVFEEESAVICQSGMHFCDLPHSVFEYYSAGENHEFAEVEALAEAKTDDNSKYTTTKLRVGAKVSVFDICKISVSAFFEKFGFADKIAKAKKKKGAVNAGYRGAANAGDSGAANAGNRGAANAGDSGAANAGDCG